MKGWIAQNLSRDTIVHHLLVQMALFGILLKFELDFLAAFINGSLVSIFWIPIGNPITIHDPVNASFIFLELNLSSYMVVKIFIGLLRKAYRLAKGERLYSDKDDEELDSDGRTNDTTEKNT